MPLVIGLTWQPWVFMGVFIGLPVVLAIFLAKKK
jgi:hypothetical protein